MVLDLTKIFFAKPKQRRAIHFGVAADPIMDTGMESLTLLTIPGFVRLILAVDENGSRVPVLSFARQKITAFEQQDAFAARRQTMCKRCTTCPGSDDDKIRGVQSPWGNSFRNIAMHYPPVAKPGNKVMPPSTKS